MNNNFFIFLLIALSFVFCKETKAQYNNEYTQYVFNAVSLNPAYTGSRRVMNASAIYRNQFLTSSGDGGPISTAMTWNGPIYDGNNSIGIWIENDELGIFQQIKIYGLYSFRAKLNEKVSLNLGIQAGIKNYIYNRSVLLNSVFISPELYTAINQENQVLPNVGAGAYLYADNFAFGLAAPHLIASSVFVSDSLKFNTLNHLIFTGAYVFPLSLNVKLKPTVMLKLIDNKPSEFSIGANFIIIESFTAGIVWRNFAPDYVVDLLFQVQVNPQMRFGYAHNLVTSYNKSSNNGVASGQNGAAHEIMIGYDFATTDKEIAMPRYF